MLIYKFKKIDVKIYKCKCLKTCQPHQSQKY